MIGRLFEFLITVMLAPDGGGGGGNPEVPGAEPPPAEQPPADGNDPFKGWWASQLPDETREKHRDRLLALKDRGLGDVMDDYFGARESLERAIVPPGKGAKPEEVKAFLKKMDIPETPEGYNFKPEALDGSGEETKKFAGDFAQAVHKMGLTRKQGAQVFAEIAVLEKTGIARMQAAQKAIAESFDQRLAGHLGGDGEKAKEAKEYFKRFIVSLRDKDLAAELKSTGILYSPRFAAAMAAYHRAASEEPQSPGSGRPGHQKSGGGLGYSDQWKQAYGEAK
jgi:hypothetical protein